jgi:hypothetical protein
MKLLLKSFLILLVLLAGIYAATPLWLSYVLARQLPPGWQLEELQSGYPGLAGIKIDTLRVKGEFATAGLVVTSSDLRFDYEGPQTAIGRVALDVYLGAGSNWSTDTLTLDDLSLPVTKLAGQLPMLSVDQVRVAFHPAADPETGINMPARPFLLDFNTFKLDPRADNSFHLASQVIIADSLQFTGQLDLDVSPALTTASIRFPGGTDLPPWLAVEIQQQYLPLITSTHVEAVVNADTANRDWLDSVMAAGSGRTFTQVSGRLEIQANFSGQDLQDIETLSLLSENLRLVSESGTLDFNANLLADREDGNIVISTPAPVKMQYQGETGWIDALFKTAVPGLQLTPRSGANVICELGTNSTILFSPGSSSVIRYSGDVKVDLVSSTQNMKLKSTGLRLETADFSRPESTTATGVIAVDWEVNAPIAYTSEDQQLTADTLSINAKVKAHNGQYFSTGGGKLMQAHFVPQAVSATEINLAWQELDLINLTGKLSTRTQGFITEFDNETWTGFDFDMNYTLLSQDAVSGAGTLIFALGPELPFEFAGNTKTERWNIKFLPATIKLAKIRKLLSVAHFKLPAAVKLTDGYIEVQGDVLVDGEITANMLIGGHEMGASMHESSARQASFAFNSGFDQTLRASGPLAIETVSLAGGVDLTHIKSELELESTERLELKNLSAEVFDGQLTLGSLQVVDNMIADTTVEFSHISLAKILAYVDVGGLEGTGFLDISLPVGSDQTGLRVRNGTFRSTVPGRLAYKIAGVAATNIGLQAMENFQYKDLSGTFNYQADGAYQMTIRLEGKNPDLYGGHPVIFNLTINGSLPAVFEAMFITGSFEEAILKELKSNKKP